MTFFEIAIIVIGIILNIAGLFGNVLPALPGHPLNYISLLLIHFTGIYEFSTSFLIIFLAINLIIFGLDYILPIWGAKLYGASKYGIWGSIIGLIAGFIFFPPLGMIIGVLLGAVIGELAAGKKNSEALRAGIATFLASMFMIIVKVTLAGVMFFYFVKGVFFS